MRSSFARMRAWGLLALGIGLLPAVAHANAKTLATAQQVRRIPMRMGPDGAVALRVFEMRLHGIPVRGTSRSVWDDGSTVAAPPMPALEPAQVEPAEAELEAADVPAAVATALDLPDPVTLESPPTLVYVTRLGAPVLAWEAQLPLRMHPEPSRPTVWISAMTGRLLEVREQVRTAQARVFAENPSTTPEPIEVTLPRLDAVEPGQTLESPTVAAFNCVAQAPDEPVDWVDEGECYPVHSAIADARGDFFVELPEVIREGDNVQPADAYAELSMYYHGARFLDALVERGVPQFQCEQATMLANLRNGVDPDDDETYVPVNNAFFTNQCDPTRGVSMMFGQGSEVDFAYDGDVVYHELGHGVVALLTPEGLNGRRERDDALLSDAGGMNEAIADYMAYMLTGDPRVGEYVGRFWASNTRGEIRTGENTKRCPQDTIGQVHNDGEPFAAALWSLRSRLDEPQVVDQIVLRMLPRLASDASLEDGAAAVLEVAGELREEGDLSAQDIEFFERALATRGLLDCPRVITDPDRVQGGRTMHLRRNNVAVQPFYPGPMQLRFEVPPGARAAYVDFGLRGIDAEGNGARVLVKRADERMHFTYELVAVDDPGDSTGHTGRIREVTWVSGDWDEEIVPVEKLEGGFEAVISGVQEGDVLHVGLVALSGEDMVASGVKIRAFSQSDMGTGTDSDGLDDDGGDVEPNVSIVSAQATTAGGCGCRATPRSAILPLAWLLLPFARRRRRRR